MRIAARDVVAVLVLLSMVSGAAKALLVPEDVEFFGRYGFGTMALIGFGALQLVGGLLMVFARTRVPGSSLVAITFLVSSALLLHSGSLAMGTVSLLVTALVGAVAFQSLRTGANTNAER